MEQYGQILYTWMNMETLIGTSWEKNIGTYMETSSLNEGS